MSGGRGWRVTTGTSGARGRKRERDRGTWSRSRGIRRSCATARGSSSPGTPLYRQVQSCRESAIVCRASSPCFWIRSQLRLVTFACLSRRFATSWMSGEDKKETDGRIVYQVIDCFELWLAEHSYLIIVTYDGTKVDVSPCLYLLEIFIYIHILCIDLNVVNNIKLYYRSFYHL